MLQALRVERSAAKSLAVQRIAATDLSAAMKLERIRAIDALQDPEEISEIVRQAAAQAARLRAARVQRALKRPPQPVSFLRFLFRERRRLRDFGRKTHTVEVTLLPPGVRPDRELQRYFLQSLQPWAAELSPLLQGILEHSWLYLNPYQYNLLVLLAQLSDRILAFDFVRLDYRGNKLIDALRRIERPFLTLACSDAHLPAILDALQSVCKKSHAAPEQCAQLGGLAERLLSPEAGLPSLYNVVLGLNGAKCRRLMLISDLVSPELRGLINARDFDCAGPRRKRIDGYLRESVASVRQLHQRLFEARRLESYVRRDPQGQADTTALAAFYEGGAGEHDLLADQADTVRLVSRLCRRFDRVYQPLLSGRIRLAGGGGGSVFTRGFFEEQFIRLRALADKLDKGPFHFGDFPLQRYLRIKAGGLAAIGAEGEAAQLVDEAAEILVDLGRTVSRVLSLRRPAAPQGGGGSEPLSPLVLQGKSFSLPMESEVISAPAELKGRTVADALAETAQLCFTCGLLFRDGFLHAHLARLRSTEIDLQNRLRLLENLMVPEDYRELEEKLR